MKNIFSNLIKNEGKYTKKVLLKKVQFKNFLVSKIFTLKQLQFVEIKLITLLNFKENFFFFRTL